MLLELIYFRPLASIPASFNSFLGGKETDRQTDRQADRQTDRQTDIFYFFTRVSVRPAGLTDFIGILFYT